MTTYSKPVYQILRYTGTSQYSGGTDPFGTHIPASVSTSSPQTYYLFNEELSGGDLPGYRQVIKGGGNAMNAVSAQQCKFDVGTFSGKATRWANPFWHDEGVWTDTLQGQIRVSDPTLPAYSSSATNRALSSFIKKANGAVTSIQGGVFLGELRETIHTIRHPMQGIRGLLSSHLNVLKKRRGGFRTGSKRSAEGTRKDINSKLSYLRDQWLETSYAIKPLLSDVKSGAEALAKIATRHQTASTIRGYGEDTVSVLDPQIGNELSQGTLRVAYTRSILDVSQSRYYGALLVEGSNARFNLDALGLNWDQFFPTLWELIPYSFVADYFANVGNMVEAASFCTSRLKYWGSSNTATRLTNYVVTQDNTNKLDPSYISSSVSPGKTSSIVKRFDRVEFPSLVPSLEFKVPTYANVWANLVALAAQHRALTPY